jgi:ABC-type glycerol-3-phosphate transport system substrate-binding protein
MRLSRVSVQSAVLLAVLITCFAAPIISAQNTRTPIKLFLPLYIKEQLDSAFYSDFEQENPNYTIVIETGELNYYPSAYNLEQHLSTTQALTSTADVLFVSNVTPSIEATRAGLFLDLRPLIASDMAFDSSVFLPGMLESFTWDDGVWALPAGADLPILAYNATKFDEVGIPYPDANWTINDLAEAARALTVRDENGAVQVPGLVSLQTNILLRGFVRQPLYDPLTGSVQLTTPENVQVLETLHALNQEGVLNTEYNGDYAEVPLSVNSAWALQQLPGEDQVTLQGTIFPTGSFIQTMGFAISAGTANPEGAYALAKYLIGRPSIAEALFATSPAQRSLLEESPTSFNYARTNPRLPEAARAWIDDVLANPLPGSELLFAEYLTLALNETNVNGGDAFSALQNAEAQANSNLQRAADMRGTLVVQVATPVPTPALNAGEIALRFGIADRISPLPNQRNWENAIDDFVAADNEVGQIQLDVTSPETIQIMTERYDCFYVPGSMVDGDLSLLRNLDPYFDTDPNFDEADFLSGVLNQVQRNDRIWALPTNLQLLLLRYNSRVFEEWGIPAPINGWTVDQFSDALQQLKTSADAPEPFQTRYYGGTHMLMLIAAYGGLPIDFRADPPVIQFTESGTVNAIREVLDLARNGYIAYSELLVGGQITANPNDAIYAEFFDILSGTFRGDPSGSYRLATFPRGTLYTPMSFNVGALYISAQSAYADACYRWISYAAQQPDLISAIPVRRSQLNSESFMALQNADLNRYFEDVQTTLNDPGLVIFPAPYDIGASSARDLLYQVFLYRAFDRYVLEGADLETELANAQTLTEAFQGCTANIPPPAGGGSDSFGDYSRQFVNCAVEIDPSLKELFGLE